MDAGLTLLQIDGVGPQLHEKGFVARGCILVGDVRLGARSSIWYGSVLRADVEKIEIGADTNVQDGCIVHADHGEPAVLGGRVTVGHGAIIHSARVQDATLIGMRAVVLNAADIGPGSLVASGAVVPRGMVVPPGSFVAGIPAQVRRPITEEERAQIESGWRHYVAERERHRRAMETVGDARGRKGPT